MRCLSLCISIASVETTGTVLACILISVANSVWTSGGVTTVTINPFQVKILEELNSLRESHVSAAQEASVSGAIYSFKDVNALPYIEAVVKEGLRVFASASVLERVVPSSKGFRIQGQESFWIPPGTTVGAQSWSMHRKEEIWGVKNGDDRSSWKYIPDRWITDPSKLEEMDKHFMPFGRGTRSCAGKNMAIMVMKLAIAELVTKYEVRINKKVNPDEEMELRDTHFVSGPPVTGHTTVY